ncbi:DUF3263 domain-containing protein [Microbacterium sp. BG28]|uniref:DUF3263 domain-containing protein n=1 Tax=Microbacterium sp. BG28 TaxID=3097356 RepID=UPI002A5A5370|nr:DUF3263 domain-containing protein [Microbacterium sp. BG28]MDY0830761.1 DUF3263 domain-containing protein [Microbacterium sp. BG28]
MSAVDAALAAASNAPGVTIGSGLTVADLLAFAAAHPDAAAAESDIIRELAVSPARYSQLLSRAIDRPEALVIDAVTTHALLRRREEIRGRRSALARASAAVTASF